MASYHFRAVAADGKARTGILTADDEKRAASELRRQGLIPVYVGAAPQARTEFKFGSWKPKRGRNVLFFTQELSTLLTAGIPLDRALSITVELTPDKEFRSAVQDILRTLKGGKSLADSLATKPVYFPEIYINMVRAGEASGSLGPIFERIAEYERTRDDLRGYIISAMVYPALLTVVGFSSILILLYYVVPRFATVFNESRMKIPTPTRILLDVSAVVREYGGVALLVVFLAIVAMRLYVRTPLGRIWWDRSLLRAPLLGDAIRKSQTAQFARAMGTLIANGVPLVQGLTISRGLLTNRVMADSLEMVTQGVKRGEGLSSPLSRTAQFPPLLGHLLSVGEETGRLDTMFARAAEIYDADTREAIKRFTSLFEPLVILVMGIAVGALILSMLLAITGINEVVV